MGYLTSTNTTSTKTAPLSERGEMYDSILKQMLFDNLKTIGGYNVTPKNTVRYDDEGRAAGIQKQIADLDAKIASQPKDATRPAGQPGLPANIANIARYLPGGLGTAAVAAFGGSLQDQRDSLQRQLDGMKKTETTDFSLTKAEDPRVQAAIDRYGDSAPEVQKIRESVKVDAQQKVENNAGIEREYLKNLNKLVSGDLSYSPEQEASIEQYIGPIRNVIKRTTDDLLTQYGESDKALRSALHDVSDQIDKTGFATLDALKAADVQYEKSGESLMGVLKKVNEDANAKAKFEFDLLSQQADQRASAQAALLGLPPGSQSEKMAAMKMKTDALKSIQLDLNAKESQGALQIQGGVEQGKMNISLSRVQLAQSQGEKKEGVAKTALDLTGLLQQKIEGAIGARGNADIALEQQKQGMLFNLIPNAIAAGQQGLGFQSDLKSAELARQQALLNPIQHNLDVEQQRTFAEATTTQKQKKSILDATTDILGTGAAIAGAVLGTGGGGAPKSNPVSFAPVGGAGGANAGLNLSTYFPTAQPTFTGR